MLNDFYLSLESITPEQDVCLQDCIKHLTFNHLGLIPVIAQCQESKEVLMHAWMNLAALEKTLATGQMTYWSRSRNAFWIKGETSGNTQQLINMRFDCDGDTILCQVKQIGAACHTGRPNCFYLNIDNTTNTVKLHRPASSLASLDN
jgi:phosphoribosyl-AMP cyclohydrolase